jgi:hypothetical protein
MNRFTAGVLLCGCLILAACNQPFQPDGAYNGRLALYAILSVTSDTQYVRISSSYQSNPGGDVTDAVVDVIPGNGKPTVHFRDTTVVRTDPTSGTATYNVYVAYGFTPESYVSYQVSARSPSAGTAQGTTVALGHALASIVNPQSLGSSTDSVVLAANFGTSRGAFVLRLFIEYERTFGVTTTLQKAEVPLSVSFDVSGNPTYTYPAFAPVPPIDPGYGFATGLTYFPKNMFTATETRIMSTNPSGSVQITGVLYTMTQIDDALYDYYYILNGPKDPSTIRLDAPDYTNVTGGLGIVACTQMVSHEVPLTQ